MRSFVWLCIEQCDMRGRNGPPAPSLPFFEVLFAILITSGCAQDLYQLPGHELFAVNQLWVCSLNFPHQHLSSALFSSCLINVNVINCNQPPNPSTTPYSPPIHPSIHPSTHLHQEPRSTAWQLLLPGGTPPEQRGQRAVWSAEADGLFVHGGLPGLAGEPDLGRGLKGPKVRP